MRAVTAVAIGRFYLTAASLFSDMQAGILFLPSCSVIPLGHRCLSGAVPTRVAHSPLLLLYSPHTLLLYAQYYCRTPLLRKSSTLPPLLFDVHEPLETRSKIHNIMETFFSSTFSFSILLLLLLFTLSFFKSCVLRCLASEIFFKVIKYYDYSC